MHEKTGNASERIPLFMYREHKTGSKEHQMELTTERLILRPWKDSDAESLYEYAKDERVGPVTGWPAHSCVEESLQVIRTVLSDAETYAVCLREDGRAIGCVDLKTGEKSNMDLKEKEGEIGYWLGVPFWGRGLIPEAVRELMRRAFGDLGYETLWCGYFDGNDKSRRVMEKCGFTYDHTNKDIHWKIMDDIRTEHVYRLTKEEWLNSRSDAGAEEK